MLSPMGLHHGFVLLLKGTGVMFSSFLFLITWIVIIIAAVVAKEL